MLQWVRDIHQAYRTGAISPWLAWAHIRECLACYSVSADDFAFGVACALRNHIADDLD